VNGRAAAKELLERLAAEPRPAGSAAEARTRALCSEWLRERGFALTEEPFTYSELPGRWSVVAAGGIALAAALTIAAQPAAAAHVVPLALLALGTLPLLSHHLVLHGSTLRRSSVNLVAIRGEPRLWLAAHLDSKSQPLSMRARILAITAVVLGLIMLLALWLSMFFWLVPPDMAWRASAAVLAAGALPLVLCTVGSDSHGAVDNAAGAATILLAAAVAEGSLGIVLTSAEELDLAGARAWVQKREPALLVNVDGVDDAGEVRCIIHRGASRALADSVEAAGAAAGVPVRIARLPPGVLMDSVVFARAGWKTVALSRVSWPGLGRIHTSADRAERCNGTGIASIAAILGETVRRHG
jgi:hypothetical protein